MLQDVPSSAPRREAPPASAPRVIRAEAALFSMREALCAMPRVRSGAYDTERSDMKEVREHAARDILSSSPPIYRLPDAAA